MALNEACQLWIEQEIDSGLERGDTPYAIGQLIAKEVEKLFEVKIPPETIRSRARRQKKKEGEERSNDQFPKKVRIQTKPETKSALNTTVKAIEANEVSQEDVKAVTDVVAQKIYAGELPYNLAEPVTHAMNAKNPSKPKRRKNKGVTLKSIHSRINGAANDLLGYLDSGLKPQGNDINYYEGIRHSAPVLMMCFHKMGIDIDKVMATVRGKPKEVEDEGTTITIQ